jgi:hypothetical protein
VILAEEGFATIAEHRKIADGLRDAPDRIVGKFYIGVPAGLVRKQSLPESAAMIAPLRPVMSA